MIPQRLVKVWKWYQHSTWYSGIAFGEYQKALRFLNESLLISIYLKSKGVNVTILDLILFNLVMLIITGVTGWGLVKIKTTQINNTIANTHNDEMQEILEWVREQKNGAKSIR